MSIFSAIWQKEIIRIKSILQDYLVYSLSRQRLQHYVQNWISDAL